MQTLSEPPTRWAWSEIDTGALRRNTRAFKGLIGARQRLCCVVKADAYGHGAAQCAKVMHAAGADMFAVATVL
ncbi:alanine racemase, partial [gut metagenome]